MKNNLVLLQEMFKERRYRLDQIAITMIYTGDIKPRPETTIQDINHAIIDNLQTDQQLLNQASEMNKKEITKLRKILSLHHCTLFTGGCECVAMAQELSSLGYENRSMNLEGKIL